jgi:hypothetical protein
LKYKYYKKYSITILKTFAELIIMSEKTKHPEDCNCDKPEIRDSFKNKSCSKSQIVECHGIEMLKKMEAEGKI